MSSIEKQIKELMPNNMGVNDVKALETMNASTKEFQDMVNRGIAKPRGYNLLTIDNLVSNSFAFNVTNNVQIN